MDGRMGQAQQLGCCGWQTADAAGERVLAASVICQQWRCVPAAEADRHWLKLPEHGNDRDAAVLVLAVIAQEHFADARLRLFRFGAVAIRPFSMLESFRQQLRPLQQRELLRLMVCIPRERLHDEWTDRQRRQRQRRQRQRIATVQQEQQHCSQMMALASALEEPAEALREQLGPP